MRLEQAMELVQRWGHGAAMPRSSKSGPYASVDPTTNSTKPKKE